MKAQREEEKNSPVKQLFKPEVKSDDDDENWEDENSDAEEEEAEEEASEEAAEEGA